MISLVVVNYRAAALAAEAIRTARLASSQPLHVVVVDNSCDAREAEALREHCDTLLVSLVNRGYAGAINDARRVCTGGIMIVSNPDVTFAANAIDLLRDALHDSAAAGPALFWDDAYTWMLPPGDLDTGWERVDAMFASRSRAWFEQRDRRRFLRRVAFWSLQETSQTNMLSGAVLALRLDAFDALGGFDERFPLYFEETDFLRRLTQARKRIVYVPRARCRHLYNQSAAQVASEAAARYAQSEMRYLEKWNGPFAARTLKRLEKPMHVESPPSLEGALQCERDDLVIEASPLPTFATAAGHFPRQRSVTLPAEVRASMHAPFYMRAVVRATGEVVATYTIAP